MLYQAGEISHLFIKHKRSEPMMSQTNNSIILEEKLGILGDVNADRLSPRQVLVVSSSILKEFKLNPGDLRENLVINNLDLNSLTSGDVLQIGSTAKLRLTFNCEACKFVKSLSISPSRIYCKRGILGVIIQGGVIKRNDPVFVIPKKYPIVPDKIYDRFLWIVKKIPHGKIMTYSQLLNVLGGSRSYFRVIPAFIKKTSSKDLPIHRILDSKGRLIPYVPYQEHLLKKENVVINNQKVNIIEYSWQSDNLYYEK
jgi:alkylated DNA nucleotide flippase Atl1